MPRKIPYGKKQLSVLISTETYNKLMKYVVETYGKYHGALSKCVEDILNHFLSNTPPSVNVYTPKGGEGDSPPSPTHTHVQNSGNLFTPYTIGDNQIVYNHVETSKTQDRVKEAFNEVIQAYKGLKKIDYHPYEVLYSDFIQAIQKVKGIDPRTVDKYVNLFKSRGLIEIETRGKNTFVKILYGNPQE